MPRPIRPRRRWWPAIAAATALQGSPAPATVTLESVHREVSTFGALDVAGTAEDAFEVNQHSIDVAGPFDEERTTALEAQQTSITSHASQLSHVGPESFVLDGAFASNAVLGPSGLFAEGFASSLLMLRFHLDAPGVIRLAGTLVASGNGTSLVQIDDAGGAIVWERRAQRATIEFDTVVPLGAGSWTLHVQSGGYGRADASASTPSAGSFATVADFAAVTDAGSALAGRGIAIAPNPMRDESVVRCGLGVPRGTPVAVHDVAGRRVRQLGVVTGAPLVWDARDDRGVRVPAGVYLVQAAGRASGRVVVTR